jgi:osmoprotectant transport system permease protein
MSVFSSALEWLTNPGHWSGSNGIPTRIFEHMQITLYAVVLASLIAIPVGMYVGHRRRFEFTAVTVGNLGRALPSFGILAIFFAIPFISRLPGEIGFWPTLIAMFFLAIPPILTNAYVGVRGVDADTLEAARGMGMTELEILRRIELPLAAPLIVAGLRTAAVQVVATVTLAALGGGGGLGRYIVDGRQLREFDQLLAGAILLALLAIATEFALGIVESLATPRLTRSRRRGLRPTRLRMQPGPAA